MISFDDLAWFRGFSGMPVLSMKISIASILQITGLLVPLSFGIAALLWDRNLLGNSFLGVFLVLFSLQVSVFAPSGREYLLRMPFLLVLLGCFPLTYGSLFNFCLRSFLR